MPVRLVPCPSPRGSVIKATYANELTQHVSSVFAAGSPSDGASLPAGAAAPSLSWTSLSCLQGGQLPPLSLSAGEGKKELEDTWLHVLSEAPAKKQGALASWLEVGVQDPSCLVP